jgi:glucose/arabinose dehydrogenase
VTEQAAVTDLVETHEEAPVTPTRSPLRAITGVLVVALVALPALPVRAATITAQPIATGLAYPAAFAFAPDGRIFYVERTTGEVRILDGSTDSLFFTIPHAKSLDGIALHPNYPSTPYVYVWGRRSFSGTKKDQLLRIKESGGTGTSMKVILETDGGLYHYGGDVDFGPDGKLYLMIGDEDNPANSQDLSSPAGKILRMNAGGGIPSGNPFPNSRVWAFGLRNSIGMTFDPATDRLWMVDNGPECNDEVDRIIKGRNYGWGPSETCLTPPEPPVNTNQDGPDPVLPTWWFATTIGPTGAEFCSSCGLGSGIEARLLFGDVNFGQIHAATLNATRTGVVSEAVVYTQSAGVLSIETGTDGSLYFSDPVGIYKLVSS